MIEKLKGKSHGKVYLLFKKIYYFLFFFYKKKKKIKEKFLPVFSSSVILSIHFSLVAAITSNLNNLL